MSKKIINQKDILNLELLNVINYNYIFNNSPIKRLKIKVNKIKALENLKKKINSIQDCGNENNEQKIVFGDGNINSKIMIIEDAPGQLEVNSEKPFMGEPGKLLKKMLEAINLKREDIYLTNFFKIKSYQKKDTNKYLQLLEEHISIINPKILILMGNISADNFFINVNETFDNIQTWKKIKLNENEINIISSFHPSYLIKYPDKKKISWEHLKNIKKKLNELSLAK